MRTKDIMYCRNNYSIGDKIKCQKFANGDKYKEVEAVIIGKYPYFAMVTDNKMRWCVLWVDIIIQNGR